MAIRIPILTSFDPKGLRQANAQFAKLQTSIGSLGRNFAVAGTAIVAGTALLGKAVQSASNFEAEFEGVNQVFGDAARSVQNFAEQAARTAGLSATEALRASKTFGLFATGAGLGTQQAAKFSTTMVQLAGDLGSFNDVPTDEALAAIQSGLMGQAEPLRKFGVFLDDNRLKQALFNATGQEVTGTLDSQQKMMAAYYAILQQTTVQQGDYIKYQDTLGNQLKTISTEFENLTKDIGLMLIPAITQALPQIKEMARQLGSELKTAIKSVDWEGLTKTVVDLVRFFSQNATTIIQVVTAIFALNTAYKAMQVAIGLVTVALELKKWALAKVASGMTAATIATTAFSAALKLIPFVAIAAGIGLIITGMNEADSSYRTTTPVVTSFGQEVLKTGHDAEWAAGKYGVLKDAMQAIPKDIKTTISISAGYDSAEARRLTEQAFGRGSLDMSLGKFDPDPKNDGGGKASASQTFEQSIIRDTKLAGAQGQLQGLKFSQGYIDGLLGSQGGLKEANKLIKKATSLPIKKQTAFVAKENKKFAGTIGEVNRVAAENAALLQQQAAKDAADLAAAQEKAKQDELNAIAERDRIYKSFADSVKNTFAGIKNSIMGAFDLTSLGGSTNSITRNMDKLLTRLKGFATNVKNLASMGLNPALLQQVISAGPLGGAKLAEALVMGGQAGLSAINAGYSEFGALSSQIAQTGTESLFNQGAQQSIYNINVDGGVGSGSTIGKAIVDAIKAYERTSGAVWQGA